MGYVNAVVYQQMLIAQQQAASAASLASLTTTVGNQGSLIAGLQSSVAGLQSTIQLIDGQLTAEIQGIIADLANSGVYVPKFYSSTTKSNGASTMFDAPQDFVLGSSVGFVIVDNVAYKVVDGPTYANALDNVVTVVQTEGGRQAQFKYPPSTGVDSATGQPISTNLYWTYFITTGIPAPIPMR